MAAVEKDVSYNEMIVSNMLSLKRTFNPLIWFSRVANQNTVFLWKICLHGSNLPSKVHDEMTSINPWRRTQTTRRQ